MKELCDGCDRKKRIYYIDEYGKGFCKECCQPDDKGYGAEDIEVKNNDFNQRH